MKMIDHDHDINLTCSLFHFSILGRVAHVAGVSSGPVYISTTVITKNDKTLQCIEQVLLHVVQKIVCRMML